VNSQDEVCFGVQFTTRTTKVSANTFSELPQVWYYEHGGNYKYVSGKYDSFKDASKAMKTVREGEFKDAFVVAFVNGKRVSRIDAEEKQKQLKR
jgi:N-acetylmuramoyl-L-alanine amidase